MSNDVIKWKKYLLQEQQQSTAAAKQEQQAAEAKLKGLLSQVAQAKIEVAQKQAAYKAAEKLEDITSKTTNIPTPSTQGTIGTTETMEESEGYGFMGRSDGTVGKQPRSLPEDLPNANGPKHLAMEEELTEEELEEACGQHEGIEEGGKSCMIEIEVDEVEEEKQCNECRDCTMCSLLTEAKYKGKKVPLGKPMRGDVKKFKVFVRDPKTGNVKKVNFGDKKMRIKKNNPKRRKSFRARHRCANPGPRTKARYWSCRKW